MKNTKKTIAGIMAFAMMLSLASCGEKGGDNSTGDESNSSNSQSVDSNSSITAETIAEKSYKAVELDDLFSLKYVSTVQSLGDKGFLVIGNSDDGQLMYIVNSDFTDASKIAFELDSAEKEESYYNAIPMSDGSILIFVSTTTYGDDVEMPDYDDPDFDYDAFDWEEFYDSAERSYKVVNIDTDGVIISENEISGLDKYIDEDEQLYLGNTYRCGDGVIMMIYSGNRGEGVLVSMSKEGVIGDKIQLDMYSLYTSTVDNDGNMWYVTWSDDGPAIKKIDGNSMSLSDEVINIDRKTIDYVNNIYPGTGDYAFYVSNSSALFGVKSDGSLDEIINWFDSDLNGDYIQALVPVENEEFIMYERNWQTDTNGFYRLTKRDASELQNVEVLTMYVPYADNNVMQQVNAFNKSQDKYRIKVDDYQKYYEWDDEKQTSINTPENQVKMDIASGKKFDIVYTSGYSSLVNILAKQGAFTDLYEFMGKDGTVGKDDILPNIIESGEIDGELVAVYPSFSVSTWAAKKKFADKENWSFSDLYEACENLPDDMTFMKYSMSRSQLLSQFAMTGGFIDYDNAKCSFNSEDFVKLLELCKSVNLREELDYESMTDEDWTNYYNETEASIRNDKAFLEDVSLYGLRDYAHVKYGTFNNDMCLVGIPSNDGRGAMIQNDNGFAIMADSPNKEAAWDFISTFFTDDYQSSDRLYSIPSLKSAFAKKLDETMEKPYWVDEDGKKNEYEDTYYIADEEIKIPCLSKDERDELEKYILGAKSKGFYYDESIYKIIEEESEAFFNDERSAQETADLIQSRCSIIISEQF